MSTDTVATQQLNEGFPAVAVCAPCYNEAEGLTDVVRDWLTVLYDMEEPFELLMVDDGSTDGSKDLLAQIADREPRLLYLRFEDNQGYGISMNSAVEYSRAHWVLTIDSDGQFNMEDLPPMLEMARSGQYDVISGVRRKKDPRMSALGGDKLLRFMGRVLHGMKTTDPQCAFKLWRGDALRHITKHVEPEGFLTPSLWVLAAQKLGLRIGNMSVHHLDRSAGESKLDPASDGPAMVASMTKLKKKLKNLEPFARE